MSTIKGQFHEVFETFIGPDLATLGQNANKFLTSVPDGGYAAKSIAVLADENRFVLSIGYRDDEPGYPVSILDEVMNPADNDGWMNRTPNINDTITDIIVRVNKDVICHSLYVLNGVGHLVLLIHG